MKKITGTSLALALTLSLGATSVVANPLQDEDVAFAFGSGDASKMVVLSGSEMEVTKGEYWPVVYAVYMYAPQLTAASMWAFNAAPRIGSTINSIRYNYAPQVQNWWNSW